MKKYGYYTDEITSMIREKVEKHRARLIGDLNVFDIMSGNTNKVAMMVADVKGAISMADEIIEELEKETGGDEA